MKISIDDVIGGWYGIGERIISEKLAAIADGEEIEIIINSPGGDAYEAIAIFNLIRGYAKTHAVTVRINGLAASAATYIALAARTVKPESKVIVSENSIFMIHNPWIYVGGDYRELAKFAEYMEQLSSMFGGTYAAVSKQSEKKTRELMDAETYLVGDDIITNGFGNTFEKINETENNAGANSRDALLVNARAAITKAADTVRANFKKENIERAAAMIDKTFKKGLPGAGEQTGAGQAEKNSHIPGSDASAGQGGIMNEEELREKYPALYDAVFEKGRDAGAKAALEKERKRVVAHLSLGEKAGVAGMKAASKYIQGGEPVADDTVQAEYIQLLTNNKNIEDRGKDNPGDTHLADDGDDAKLEAAFDSGVKSGAGREE